MNMLGCLDRLSSGRYLLEGIDVSQHDKRALALIRNQKIGLYSRDLTYWRATTALEIPRCYVVHKDR